MPSPQCESFFNVLCCPNLEETDSIVTIADRYSILLNTDSINEIEMDEEVSPELKKIEYNYKIFYEKFSVMINEWLKTRKNIITALLQSEQSFRLIHRTTTGITFLSSTIELAARVGLILNDLFDFKLGTRLPMMMVPVLGGISITSSLLALSYSKTTLEDIAKEIRDEKRLLDELEILYRKGNWIDDALQEHFPWVDLNQLKTTILNVKTNENDKKSWRHRMCSIIILANIKKNKEILEDEKFLSRVKAFVKSNAAQLWINRMKIQNMLEDMTSKYFKLSKKELSSGGEVFLNLSAMNLYPVFLPLFFNPHSMGKIRLISSSVTSVITAINLGEKDGEEFQQLRKSCSVLSEEYKRIRNFSRDILNDYE